MKPDLKNKLEKLTDEEIISSFRKDKDLEVLGVLYKRYMLMVYGICMKYFKNREDSQDAVMQIFERLVQDIPRFEIRNFKGWLYTVSRNHCLMELRQGKKFRNRQSVDFSVEFMESTAVLHPIEEKENEKVKSDINEILDIEKPQLLIVEDNFDVKNYIISHLKKDYKILYTSFIPSEDTNLIID